MPRRERANPPVARLDARERGDDQHGESMAVLFVTSEDEGGLPPESSFLMLATEPERRRSERLIPSHTRKRGKAEVP